MYHLNTTIQNHSLIIKRCFKFPDISQMYYHYHCRVSYPISWKCMKEIWNPFIVSVSRANHTLVGFIYTFQYSLLSTSSILEFHHLQMTSSEGYKQHFSVISKFVCCGFYIKKNVAFTLISFAVRTEMRWMFIRLTVIWVTRSDTSSVASRARSQLTKSKCECD